MNITTIHKIGRILMRISLLILICIMIYRAFTLDILFGIAITTGILSLVGLALSEIENL